MALSLLLPIHKGMASSSLRALDAVALATNVSVIMKWGTKPNLGLVEFRGSRDNNILLMGSTGSHIPTIQWCPVPLAETPSP